jgi:hypothetical protein
MPKIAYRDERFCDKHEVIITHAVDIVDEYQAQDIELTLRQLYYQFVARGLLQNRDQNYKMLGEVIQRARYAGRIDWLAIVDRTRYARTNSHWQTPGDIIHSAAVSYAVDKWSTSPCRAEIWIEKDALIGIAQGAASALDCTSFSCRGYTSASEVWVAAGRMIRNAEQGQDTHVIHLGDHDPSGIDMSRDIETRLREFMGFHGYGEFLHFKRIALNMDQVRRYNPPPNPAKITDSRARGYMERFGNESWELDALDPRTLQTLIRTEIEALMDDEAYETRKEEEDAGRQQLNLVSENWDDVRDHVVETYL